MSDIETIKARIRKLMAVAGDGVATDGEIDNAMRLAAKLLDQHHLASDDIDEQDDADDLTMGRSFATTQSERFSTWESTLSNAITNLFGCVKCYISHETQPIRVNGIAVLDGDDVRYGRKIAFYGPASESADAASLFEEWARSIATMGVARWGGCFRGDGAMYCMGFAQALYDKSKVIVEERRLVQAKPIPRLTGGESTAITLSDRYDLLADAGKKWLKEECKINLGSAGRRSGYRAGDRGAYAEGKQHGSAATFNKTTSQRKMIS